MSDLHGVESRPGDLDPLDAPERWESLVHRIDSRAEPYLAARREPASVLDVVARWARPALASAATLLLLAAAGAVMSAGSRSAADSADVTLARAVMPSSFAAWITGSSEPTIAELAMELETLEEVE